MVATVVDLFSGGGGASRGFAGVSDFSVVGAADAQIGKPSSGPGTLECNGTYETNVGIKPVEADLGRIDPGDLASHMGLVGEPTVLVACPPCTGFSRANSENHVRDDGRNALVPRMSEFVEEWRPEVLVMENARELVMGRFRSHLQELTSRLERIGYSVHSDVYFLNRFGLPQRRERALVLAVRRPLQMRTMDDLWENLEVRPEATHVRHAIGDLPWLRAGEVSSSDPMHRAPALQSEIARSRTQAIPHNGGSWADLRDRPQLLTPAMRSRVESGRLGSHPDVYGRMWWDRPAPTLKRECAHVGNGRYTHPEQDRLCSVREMGLLNGFPSDYTFTGSLSNMYRHIGDAVPPLISYQLAVLVGWILGNDRPKAEEIVMPDSTLSLEEIRIPLAKQFQLLV